MISLGLTSCQNLTIKNTEVCAVAGVITAGADCANTLKPDTRSMSFEEFIEFLEPAENKGPAMVMSLEDFNELKTSLEIACELLNEKCTYEIKEKINQAKKNLSRIGAK